MSNNTWKSQELLDSCPKYVTDNGAVYVASVGSKINRILFLVDRFISVKDTISELESNQFLKNQLEVEIYVESIASNLHSLADVFAQVINEIVLKPLIPPAGHLSSEKVGLNKIKTKLASLTLEPVKKSYIDKIINNIDHLANSAEFLYISGFVNTIKHRKLLNTTFHLEVDSQKLIDLGFKLDAFHYKGNNFPETPCCTVVMDYREKLIDHVLDIGNSINNYCLANHIQTASKRMYTEREPIRFG
jgi:hypothetical protein